MKKFFFLLKETINIEKKLYLPEYMKYAVDFRHKYAEPKLAKLALATMPVKASKHIL
jgi:hypothetical protein